MRKTPNFLAVGSLRSQLLRWSCALALTGLTAASTVQAATTSTWTNAPTDATWTNVLNWNTLGVPGTINNTGNNGIDGTSVAYFTNAITTYGGAANPIIPDDATVANGKARMLGQIFFDGPNCGAYVFYSPSTYVRDTTTTAETGVLGLCVSGTVVSQQSSNGMSMSATVTKPQNFLIPVEIRLPSSDNGTYFFTNNATSPQATLFFNNLFAYPGATTRGVTFVFMGSNTGTNTVGTLSQSANQSTGTCGVRKDGTGRWIFAGANTFKAATPFTVLAGTLEVKDPGAFGSSTSVTVTNGTLQIDGVTLSQTSITLQNGGTILVNGSATVNGVSVGNQTGTSVTLATTSASDVQTVGDAANAMTGGGADSVVHMSGPGTILLADSANYAGKWSLDSGTNQILDPVALGLGANYTIVAGSVVDLSPMGATTYAWTTKAITANGTGTTVGSTASTIMADPAATVNLGSRSLNLTYSPTATNGDTAHPALYISRGTMACGGNAITVNNAGAPLNVGTYRLVHQASGTITASGTFATYITGNGLVSGLVGEAVANGADINLLVYPYVPQNLVWTGTDPLIPSTWDRLVSTNWLSGATPSVFNIYDIATFNATGSANPNVNLAATVVPGRVTVDTTANNYTFSGSGQIAGGATLIKMGANTLNLATVNNYSGGTVLSNGVIQLGIDNAIPSTGTGDVTNYSPAKLDLNGFSDTINGLWGNGTIDISSGGSSTLILGANDNNAVFSGMIQNTNGTVGLWKIGLGTQTLTTSNAYTGTTAIDTGTLLVSNLNALSSSAVSLTNGTLDLATNLNVASLGGSGGVIANNTTTGTNRLFVLGTSTVNCAIGAAALGGKIAVTVVGGTLRENADSSYNGGTFVSSGAGLAIGQTGNVGTGGVIASNNTTISMPTAVSTAANFTNPVTTVDGATVTFTSGETANNWNNQFFGSALATNLFSGGVMSIGAPYSFSNFLGTVIISNGTVRIFNAMAGGDNTIFDFIAAGGMFTRDGNDVVRLGALFGNGRIDNPSVSFPGIYWIGGKNIDCEFAGEISGSNNIVKVGTARLTLDGSITTTNTDSSTYTNYIYSSALSYLNTTTISNGVLALSVPDVFDNSPNITLATTNAILDTFNMGYVTNFNDVNSNPDSALITNGMLTIVAATPNGTPQTLGGIGTVRGNGVTNNGTISPGLSGAGGTLILASNLVVNVGATNFFNLSDDPSGLVTPSALLKVQSGITLSGSSVIGIGAINGVIKPGKYPLIKYGANLTNESGVVPPGPVSNFVLGGPIPATTRATLVVTNGSGEVDLGVVSINNTNLVWAGDGVSNWWDVVNSYTWTNKLGASLQFYQLDNVTFDNSSTNLSVILLGTLVPTTLAVNSSSNYIFGGTGNIGGDVTLYKTGAGSLVLTNGANTYNGGTIISNGVLSVGSDSGNNQNDLALGPGPVSVNGATAELRFGGNAGNAVNHFITNAITLSNGGILKAQDGVQHMTNTTITIGANGGVFQTIWPGKNLVLDGPIAGTGNLTISVPAGSAGGGVVLNNITNTFTGAVAIAPSGYLMLVNAAGLSNSPTIDIQAGGTLDITGRTNAASSLTLLSGQTLKGNGTVRGLQLVTSSGSTVSPGETSVIGTLTVTNTGSTNVFSTVTLGGTTIIGLNRINTPNCDQLACGTNNFGGTLTVNNLGPALALGDSFTLFTSITNKGAFALTNLPALSSGLAWSNSLAVNGKITVVSTIIVPTIPPGITNFSLVGSNVVISGTNGQSGATYYLLSTTNLTFARSQWKTIATNVFGSANFSFVGTNSVIAGSGQQFYMLSSTNYNP